MLAQRRAPGPHTAQPDDLALLPYTSGTTGLPKGCMHTHRTLMPNTVGGVWGFSGPESVALAVVPMFHITGMLYGVLGAVYGGSTLVLMPRWDRELAGRSISRYQVTHWICIPTMVIDLFGSPNYKSFDLSSLRYLSGGGAAMPQAVAQRLQDEFGLTFAEGYGLTETAAPSHAQPARAREAAMPRHPDLRRRFTHRRPADLARNCRSARSAKSSPAGRWSSRATGIIPRPRSRPSSSSRASASSAPATSAGWTRKATSSSPTA